MNVGELFTRFAKLSLVGWGGPVGRIALLHDAFVTREKWMTEKEFAKVLALYQALPGPEATEIAVYLGYRQRGFWGGVASGLGFMLPGFFLMLVLSWFYVHYGVTLPLAQRFLYGLQPAVIALIALALWKLGKENIMTKKHLFLFLLAAVLTKATALNFLWIVFGAGIFHMFVNKGYAGLLVVPFVGTFTLPFYPLLFAVFLKAGLLTFGGAYTVIPFLHKDAVLTYHWLTEKQFLEGIALSGVIPAPLVMISTFVGYVAGGVMGAVLATLGIFLPGFVFTLIGYKTIERLVENPALQTFLEGLIAAVLGLVLTSLIDLARVAVVDVFSALLAGAVFLALYKNIPTHYAIIGAGLLGFVWNWL